MDACEIANFLASELFMQQVDSFIYKENKKTRTHVATHRDKTHLTVSNQFDNNYTYNTIP